MASNLAGRDNFLTTTNDFLYRINRLFDEKISIQNSLADLHLTSEIATFAIELIIAGEVDILDFFAGLVEEPEKKAFLSLLAVGPGRQFVETYSDVLFSVITDGKASKYWVEVFSPLLAEFAPKLSDDQIEKISNILRGDVFLRFMHALLKSPHDYRPAFAVSFAGKDLTEFESMLVRYGSLYPTVENEEQFVERIILDIIENCNSEKRSIVENLLERYSVTITRLNHVFKKCIRNADDEEWKKWLISVRRRIKKLKTFKLDDENVRKRAQDKDLRKRHDKEAMLALWRLPR